MKLILKVTGLICLAVAAFSGLITLSLPIEMLPAGLFFWFVADLVT